MLSLSSPSSSLWSPTPSSVRTTTTHRRKAPNFICQLNFGLDDVPQLLHNKVLIAAGLSAAIGQVSKPFTSSIFYGKDFNLMALVQAGGFPSTHSSAVVATAATLAFERGFADSIFGLSVVYAGLIMYDAQGVRREVGIHARTLNKVLPKIQSDSSATENRNGLITSQASIDPVLSDEARTRNSQLKSANASLLLKQEKKIDDEQVLSDEGRTTRIPPLKEAIGHTEVEVIAGAFLGLFVSLAVNTIL
ncbi:hypothetical protein ACFE04_024195 [Oxalis oulophora]